MSILEVQIFFKEINRISYNFFLFDSFKNKRIAENHSYFLIDFSTASTILPASVILRHIGPVILSTLPS